MRLLLALSSLAAAQPALDARLEAMQASIDALTRTVSAQATELAALKVAQVFTSQDAQYLEIWVGTFPELVIKQSSGVGQTLAWSCQRIS